MPRFLWWVILGLGKTLGRVIDNGLIQNCMEGPWGGVQSNCWGPRWAWDGIWGKAWVTQNFWSWAPGLGEVFPRFLALRGVRGERVNNTNMFLSLTAGQTTVIHLSHFYFYLCIYQRYFHIFTTYLSTPRPLSVLTY